jgi:hypothetical protein
LSVIDQHEQQQKTALAYTSSSSSPSGSNPALNDKRRSMMYDDEMMAMICLFVCWFCIDRYWKFVRFVFGILIIVFGRARVFSLTITIIFCTDVVAVM